MSLAAYIAKTWTDYADSPDLSAANVQYIDTGVAAVTAEVLALEAALPSTYQPISAELSALDGLSSTGYAKRTGAGAWSVVSAIPQADVSGLTTALAGKEAALGNPGSSGYLLSSTSAGARSWVAPYTHPATHPQSVVDSASGWITDALAGKQASLGFTPVQQGGGTSQTTNKLYIGWSAGAALRLQVDSTDFGSTWPIAISGSSADSAKLGGQLPSYYALESTIANMAGTVDPNTLTNLQSGYTQNTAANRPGDYAFVQTLGRYNGGSMQIASDSYGSDSNSLWWRRKGDNGTWYPWKTIWHTGNLTGTRNEHNHAGVYQPLDADLTAISNLATTGFVRRTAADTWTASAMAWADISGVISYGTTAGTVCQGNDSRLSDARTPTAHTHAWISGLTGVPTGLAEVTQPQAHGNIKLGATIVGSWHGIEWSDPDRRRLLISGGASSDFGFYDNGGWRLKWTAAGALVTGTVPWGNLTGVPGTFTPESHTQAWSTITSVPFKFQDYPTNSAYEGFWPSGVTPTGQNFAILWAKDNVETYLSAANQLNFQTTDASNVRQNRMIIQDDSITAYVPFNGTSAAFSGGVTAASVTATGTVVGVNLGVFGNWKLGQWALGTMLAELSNSAMYGGTTYGMLHSADGELYLNAATSKGVHIRNNNAGINTWTDIAFFGGLSAQINVPLTINNNASIPSGYSLTVDKLAIGNSGATFQKTTLSASSTSGAAPVAIYGINIIQGQAGVATYVKLPTVAIGGFVVFVGNIGNNPNTPTTVLVQSGTLYPKNGGGGVAGQTVTGTKTYWSDGTNWFEGS